MTADLVTATRAAHGVNPNGTIRAPELAQLAQQALDDVRAKAENLGHAFDPGHAVIDVRVSYFAQGRPA